MARSVSPKRAVKPARPSYILDEQIGFVLRQVWQRHATIFAREIGINLTPTQWAALAKLTETGPCSQNLLGQRRPLRRRDRKSTRLNSSHVSISYAVFCLKKKNNTQ